jgi:hypothetical protein
MTTDTIKSTPKRGDKCANGATILDIKKTVGEGWIVLCLFPQSNYHPFVTWWAFWSQTGELSCSMGHYHDQLSEAVVDFDNRV